MTQKTVESIVQIFHNGEMRGQPDSAATTIQSIDGGFEIRSYLSPHDTECTTCDKAITLTLSFTNSNFASFLRIFLDSKDVEKLEKAFANRSG